MHRICLSLFLIAICCSPISAQKKFGFDNRKPSGQPYLKPEETTKKFNVAPGYEMKLFAGEPDVINPIAFTIDEKGRIWVVENFEYPRRTPKGKKPRDRIKILEDTTGDGKADKITIWAEGKHLPIGWDLASGIEVGHGGVFLGAPPYLFFLEDTDDDGKCDKQTVLLEGFGSQDTHETLNTFQWGPDCRLYGLHGVFTHSKINGVKMNAAVWRYHPQTKKFEVFAEGTSNPWGMDFDSHGQCHLACCVIPHLFHMVPGGTYIRQAGSSFNPYAYGLLKQSCDHTHHQESGWAHAGLLFLDGEHVPKSYRGSLIMGSIHGCSIKRDVLRPNGSTYVAGHAPDFVVSGDKNFRPINLRWGPDGSIYVIDWHDQNPCHQAPPDSWDQTRGRIYRIQRKGHKVSLSGDVGKKSSKELVGLLIHDNPWWYRTALRLLNERQDKSVHERLEVLLQASANNLNAMRMLWGIHAIGTFDEKVGRIALDHDDPWLRYWAIRFLAEDGKLSSEMMKTLTTLARTEKAPQVRLQLASSAQRLTKQDTLPLLHNLMTHKSDADDPFLPLMIWLAYEPRLEAKKAKSLQWMLEHAPGNPLVTKEIVPRTMRRLVATGDKKDLADCIVFLGEVRDSAVRKEALDGLLAALKSRKLDPPEQWRKTFAALVKDNDTQVQQLARKLSINFQDPQAIKAALVTAKNAQAKQQTRIDAIRDLALAQPTQALGVLLNIVKGSKEHQPVRAEAMRALVHFSDPSVSKVVLEQWKTLPPELRVEAVNLLSSRKPWAAELLDAVAKKVVSPTALSNNHILQIRVFGDDMLNKKIEAVWGKFRDTPEELNKLIDQMWNKIDEGRASFAHGKKVFAANCAKCHKFDGEGHEVGPDLAGASREIDYLLINVLDPNRVVGQPYYTRIVPLKDGRVVTGLLHAEDGQSITLKVENNALKTVLKKDIDGEVLVQPKSVMPEGLDKNMKPSDLRDLIRYLMASPFITEVEAAGPFPAKDIPKSEGQIPGVLEKTNFRTLNTGVKGRLAIQTDKSISGPQAVFLSKPFHSPSTMKTELRLGSKDQLRVWINGKLVYQGRPNPLVANPDQVSIPVTLKNSQNRLLIEVTTDDDQAELYARFLDRDRRLAYSGNAKK